MRNWSWPPSTLPIGCISGGSRTDSIDAIVLGILMTPLGWLLLAMWLVGVL
jgi:hypothetical protein